jgi:hypothetical protein
VIFSYETDFEAARQEAAYAYENVVFFRKHMEETGLTPNDIKTPGDFSKIPPTEKKHYRKNFPVDVLAVYHDLLTTPEKILEQNIEELDIHQPQLYFIDANHLAFLLRYMGKHKNGHTPPKAPILASYSPCIKVSKRQIEETFGRDVPFSEVVANDQYEENSEEYIRKELLQALGDDIDLMVERTGYIPTERSGKFLSCVSKVGEKNYENGFSI